jgi:RimJ/RimL family protein N-acetyltransferase
MTARPDPILTERLLLRPLASDDVGERYLAWLNDPDVSRYLETRWKPQTIESIHEFVAGCNARPNERLFGMFLRVDGRHIGNIKVGPRKPHQPYAEVSLFIGDKSAWGQGFATEAIGATSAFAFAKMDVIKLGASAYEVNKGSINAFLKAGYAIEGVRRDHYILDGKPANLVEMGLCRPIGRAGS